MRLLFCNIGWAEHYDGRQNDAPRRGGSYNDDNIGHEVCNFLPYQGKVFGYVQVAQNGKIDIGRLGAKKGTEFVDGITVVWTAGPDDGGTVVVGWYKNATVYSKAQDFEPRSNLHEQHRIKVYRIVANEADAFLLPIDERSELRILRGKGGIGQNPLWYADKPESKEIVDMVAAYIERGQQPLNDVDAQQGELEGNSKLATHLRRERNRRVVEQKKREVLKATGSLSCEACGFDFKVVYGQLGEEFCEVHHRIPLHKAEGIVKTTTADLSIMCSNCHRIIHKTELSVEQFAERIKRDETW